MLLTLLLLLSLLLLLLLAVMNRPNLLDVTLFHWFIFAFLFPHHVDANIANFLANIANFLEHSCTYSASFTYVLFDSKFA